MSRTKPTRRRRLDLDELEEGVLRADRMLLARAITLVESARPEHQENAQELLVRLLPKTGTARRVGVTGVPGVGKSTFLETLGVRLADDGRRVAVLAIDPSSAVSGGSILGDKTRMSRLATHERAFVRPSPSSGTLGGVARKTRETMLLCEAAGYDVVFVETVGVGQGEVVVAEMVDFLVLLLLPGAGDELQGIKRGILEHIDLVAVNKADGDGVLAAKKARAQYASALQFVRPRSDRWIRPVVTTSGQTGAGLDELWQSVEEHRRLMEDSGELEAFRREQQRRWLWSLVEEGLMDGFRRDESVAASLPALEAEVVDGRVTPTLAARRLLRLHAR